MGSPMPMNTMLDTLLPETLLPELVLPELVLPELVLPERERDRPMRCAPITCSTISPVLRWRSNPACPVAQKLHPMAQPAWEDTHTVVRPPCCG